MTRTALLLVLFATAVLGRAPEAYAHDAPVSEMVAAVEVPPTADAEEEADAHAPASSLSDAPSVPEAVPGVWPAAPDAPRTRPPRS